MAFEVGAVIARLELVTKDFSRGIKKAEEQTADLRMALEQVSGSFSRVAAVSGAAFAVITGGLALASRTGARFEQSMVNVGAVTGALGKNLEELSDIAVGFGETTVFSATEVAEAMFELGSSGLKAADDFKNVLKPALDLAAASQADIGTASKAILSSLAGFGLSMSKATETADIFSAANENSRLNIFNLSRALIPAAATASGFGISLKDTVAILGGLAEAGIKAERAGTALKVALGLLSKASGPAQKILEKLGFTQSKIAKLMKDPIRLFGELKTAGLSATEALQIFGTEGGPAVLAILKTLPKIRDLRDALDKGVGSAARIAARQLESTSSKFKLMGSAAESVAIQLFQTIQPAINAIILGATEIAKRLAAWIRENKKLTGIIAIGAAAITGFVAVLSSLVAVLATVGVGIVALRVSMSGLKGVAPGVISAMNKIKLAGVGLGKSLGLVGLAGIIGFTLGKVIDDIIRQNFPNFSKAIDKLIGKIVGFKDELEKVTGTASDFASRVAEAGEILIKKNLPAINTVRERSRVLRTTLEDLGISFVNLGPQTKAAFVDFKDGKIDAEQLKTELGKLGEATIKLRELQAQPIEGLSLEDQQAKAAVQQSFIDAELGFMDQVSQKQSIILSKKEQEQKVQAGLLEQIGQAINLEGKLGTVIDGVLSGTRDLNKSFGEFIKSIGKAIVKAIILQTIMLLIKTLFGGGGFIGKLLGFSGGGVVPGAQAGLLPPREDILVGIQAGEGVLTRAAVRNIGGAAGVEALNQGQGVGGKTVIFNNTLNAPLVATSEAVEAFRIIEDQFRQEFLGG